MERPKTKLKVVEKPPSELEARRKRTAELMRDLRDSVDLEEADNDEDTPVELMHDLAVRQMELMKAQMKKSEPPKNILEAFDRLPAKHKVIGFVVLVAAGVIVTVFAGAQLNWW